MLYEVITPSRLDLESYFMKGTPEEHLEGLLSATEDRQSNPFIEVYEDDLLPTVDWEQYGLVITSYSIHYTKLYEIKIFPCSL